MKKLQHDRDIYFFHISYILVICPYTLNVKESELITIDELNLKLFPGDTSQYLTRIAVNEKGEIVVIDSNDHCVYVFDRDGNRVRKIGS